MSAPPSICFVESQAYAVLNSATKRSTTGGESVQHSLLARAFADRGWDVSMVSKDIGQDDGIEIEGIRVWKTFEQEAGLPYVRFLYPRLFSMWRALRKADADIYFQSCAGLMTGVVAKYVAGRNRKMVFRVAHDTDCVPGEELVNFERDRKAYQYGLKRADLISAQSEVQKNLLRENHGLPSTVIDMAAEIPADVPDSGRDIDVLWVNNFRPFKRPELLLDIARNLPDVRFTMIGGSMKGHNDLFERIRAGAKELPNLDFVGAVPYSEVNAYFCRAKLFLNTSDSEGFPNSFLQAWVRKVPVVSYFDPDKFIESYKLGASVDTQQAFEPALKGLLDNETERLDIGNRARQFVIDRYSSHAIAKQYEELMKERFGIAP